MPVRFVPITPTDLSPRKRGRKKGVRISARQRGALIDRLEAATAAGSLPADAHLYAAILHALFPEDFPVGLPEPDPVQSAPGSAERILDYARRVRGRTDLYSPADASAMNDDRLGMVIERLANGKRTIAGWAESPTEEEDDDE